MYKIKTKSLKNNNHSYINNIDNKINALKNKIQLKKIKLKKSPIINNELYNFLIENNYQKYYKILGENNIKTLNNLYKFDNEILKKFGLNYAHILKIKKNLKNYFPENNYEIIEIEDQLENIKEEEEINDEKIIEENIDKEMKEIKIQNNSNDFKIENNNYLNIKYCYNCFLKIDENNLIKNSDYTGYYFCSKKCLNNIIFLNIKRCAKVNCINIFQKKMDILIIVNGIVQKNVIKF